MNFLGKKRYGEYFGAYKYEYIAKENDKDEIIIEAKMTINKNSKKAMKFIEKASKKNMSPLTLLLKEEEAGIIEMLKEDEYK